jgi:hypothetical protein
MHWQAGPTRSLTYVATITAFGTRMAAPSPPHARTASSPSPTEAADIADFMPETTATSRFSHPISSPFPALTDGGFPSADLAELTGNPGFFTTAVLNWSALAMNTPKPTPTEPANSADDFLGVDSPLAPIKPGIVTPCQRTAAPGLVSKDLAGERN